MLLGDVIFFLKRRQSDKMVKEILEMNVTPHVKRLMIMIW